MKRWHVLSSGLALAFCSHAFGHAELTDSSPGNGTAVDASTCHVHLSYSEGIQTRFSDFSLHYLGTDQDAPIDGSNRIARPTPEPDNNGRKIGLAMPDERTPGWYAVDWEVLAEDGHTTSGVVRFQITADD